MNPSRSSRMWMTTKQSIWENSRVEYFNPDHAEANECTTSRSLPLFLLEGNVIFPGDVTRLNLYEMRYRTMMFDCAKCDDMFGIVHQNPETENIAKYGTLVKVTKRKLLENGWQAILTEGVSRFRVRKILSTLPYCKAEVEPCVVDEIPSDENAASRMELNAYNALKYYTRLVSAVSKPRYVSMAGSISKRALNVYNSLKFKTRLDEAAAQQTYVPRAVKKSRPSLARPDTHQRRTECSFAMSSMIRIPKRDAQILLQTVDVVQRLAALNDFIGAAAEGLGTELVKANLLTSAQRDEIKLRAVNSDLDEANFPPDLVIEQITAPIDEWDTANIE